MIPKSDPTETDGLSLTQPQCHAQEPRPSDAASSDLENVDKTAKPPLPRSGFHSFPAVVIWWLALAYYLFCGQSSNIIISPLLAPRLHLLLLLLERRRFLPMECAVRLPDPPALAPPSVIAALSTTTAVRP